jgi:nitrite reductase/ring-hydroxylating ferredoxin subunit
VIRLGPADEFRRFPALVSEGLRTYFLVRSADGFALLSNVCPHERGSVYDKGTCFECPLHAWQFDRKTGRCLNEPDRTLAAFPVVIEDGILFADIPHGKAFD